MGECPSLFSSSCLLGTVTVGGRSTVGVIFMVKAHAQIQIISFLINI